MHALIIEDNPLISIMLQWMLEDIGFTSFEFATTEPQAVEKAQTRTPDLITADVNLALGTGPGAVEAITARAPVPVVFVTASPDLIDRGLRPIIVPKPVCQGRLRAAIDQATGAAAVAVA